MKRILILTTSVLLGVLLLGLLPVHNEAEIYDNVLRLHVLANSDSEYDQELKLKVRDGVLEAAAEILSAAESYEAAEEALAESLGKIEDAAAAVIADAGAGYPVSVLLGEEDYPARSYESICFPAGSYMSLRVCIGEAEGQNWWCVLFPKMCISAASKKDSEQAFIQAGLTPDQYKIITESGSVKYTVRFKLLEVIEKVVNRLKPSARK